MVSECLPQEIYFILKILFIYLFGCAGSQLQLMASSSLTRD